jgi:hypothetical protein
MDDTRASKDKAAHKVVTSSFDLSPGQAITSFWFANKNGLMKMAQHTAYT